MEIKDKKGTENSIADHLSKLEVLGCEVHINDTFPDEQLLVIVELSSTPWFADYVNYLILKVIPQKFSY